MKVILDTQILLWFLDNSELLNIDIKNIISDENNVIFLSIVSFWEIVIKLSIDKLKLDVPIERLFEEADRLNIKIVNIQKIHLLTLKNLPYYHKDPFDRLIISQAIAENIKIISADVLFEKYNVDLIKN